MRGIQTLPERLLLKYLRQQQLQQSLLSEEVQINFYMIKGFFFFFLFPFHFPYKRGHSVCQ